MSRRGTRSSRFTLGPRRRVRPTGNRLMDIPRRRLGWTVVAGRARARTATAIGRRVSPSAEHLVRGGTGILLQMPAATFTIPITISNIGGVRSWRPGRVTETGRRRTLGGVVRVRWHSRGVAAWNRRSGRRWGPNLAGRGKVGVMTMGRMPVTTIQERRLGHRLMQRDVRMPVGRRSAAGRIQRWGITAVSGRAIDIHRCKP